MAKHDVETSRLHQAIDALHELYGVRCRNEDEMRRVDACLEKAEQDLINVINEGVGINARSRRCYDTPLYRVLAYKDFKLAKMLLDAGADIDKTSSRKKLAPIHMAAKQGNYPMLCWLLDKGADADARDGRGMTPLHRAAKGNSRLSVSRLVRAGADIKALDIHGHPPVVYALKKGSQDTVRLLIPKEADTKPSYMVWAARHGVTDSFNAAFRRHGGKPENRKWVTRSFRKALDNKHSGCLRTMLSTPLVHKDRTFRPLVEEAAVLAAGNGYADCIEALIQSGSDVCASSTTLLAAVKGGQTEITRMLVMAGASLDDSGILTAAVGVGCTDIVKLLIGAGAQAESRDALKAAIRHQRADVIQVLLEHGAVVDNERCEPLALAICKWGTAWGDNDKKEMTMIVKMLVARAPQARLEKELTAIDSDQLNVLLDMGLSPDALMPVVGTMYKEKARGRWASRRRAIMRSLLGAGMRVNAADLDGNTLLHHLCMGHAPHLDLCELLDYEPEHTGDIINRCNAAGDTPLLSLLKRPVPPAKGVLSELLDRGADPSLDDSAGKTPIQVLQDNGNGDEALCELLLNHGCAPLSQQHEDNLQAHAPMQARLSHRPGRYPA